MIIGKLPTELHYSVHGLLRCLPKRTRTNRKEIFPGSCLTLESGVRNQVELVKVPDDGFTRVEALTEIFSGEMSPEKISFQEIHSYLDPKLAEVAVRLARRFFVTFGYDGVLRLSYGCSSFFMPNENFEIAGSVDLFFGAHIPEAHSRYELHVQFEEAHKQKFAPLLEMCQALNLPVLPKFAKT